MALTEADDAPKRCTWVDYDGTRCDKAPVHGGPKMSACAEHTERHRALQQEPGAGE